MAVTSLPRSYHQKVPYDAPALELRDTTYGLVAPQEFSLPAPSPLWTPVAFAAFDVSRLAGGGAEKVSPPRPHGQPRWPTAALVCTQLVSSSVLGAKLWGVEGGYGTQDGWHIAV